MLANVGLSRLDNAGPFDPYDTAPRHHTSYYEPAPVDPNHYPLVYPALDPSNERYPAYYEQCQTQNLANESWIPAIDPMLTGGVVRHYSIANWLIRGATREDDLSGLGYLVASEACGEPDPDPHGGITRVMDHFYDPIHDEGLTDTVGCLTIGPNGKCERSIDWALGYVDSFSAPWLDVFRRNHFTYADARNNMWLALVGERGASQLPYTAAARSADAKERLSRWATVFRSLGDVIHLLQDGAQPQHVRNDPHSPFQLSAEVTRVRKIYLRGNPHTNNLNAYIRGFFAGGNMPPPPRLILGNYPIPTFVTPLRFFTTRNAGDTSDTPPDNRYGLVDYTNRGFFSAGTLPNMAGDTFQAPPNLIDTDHGYQASSVPCKLSSYLVQWLTVNCVHWTHVVPDPVEPNYVDELPHEDNAPSPFDGPPIIAASLFPPGVGGPRNTLGLEEFQNMANFALPRAVAYSAGLLNFFFRGKLLLSSPPDGLYSVVDQGTEHTVLDGVPLLADGSNKVFGFTTIRVRVRNITGDENGDIIESGSQERTPQRLTGSTDTNLNRVGQLVAIARYHRNPCYAADLSGEMGYQEAAVPSSATTLAGCETAQELRTPYAEISVSAPIYIDGEGNLPGPPLNDNGSNACANVGNINTGAGADTGDCANSSSLMGIDFHGDPMQFNATDLFIQVASRYGCRERRDCGRHDGRS